MKSFRSSHEIEVKKAFRKSLDRLPVSVQEQADKACELWREDPYHNSLQFKRLSIDRVLGLLEPDDHIYWFWIGAHDEYDELLKRL